MVAVVHDGHGLGVAVQPLQLGDALEDNADAYLPAADNRDSLVHVRHKQICEIIQIEPYRDLQPVVGLLIRLGNQSLERLRVK